MKALMIATNLGQLKAYRVIRDPDEPSPTIDLIEERDLAGRSSHVAERVTDQAGRFPSGSVGMAYGERHGEAEKAERDALDEVASSVEKLAAAETESILYLAAPKTIYGQLKKRLSSPVQKRIRRSLELDLTKLPKLDLLQRFDKA